MHGLIVSFAPLLGTPPPIFSICRINRKHNRS